MKFKYSAIVFSSTVLAIALYLVNEEKAESKASQENLTTRLTASASVSESTEEEEVKIIEPQNILTDIVLDVPLLNQMDAPRLYNGCEVTSLAMILQYNGMNVTKNELAEKVARTPLQYNSGEYGNPNFGFVGNMEDGPGLGVYHDPIFTLAKSYSDNVLDLTNQPFSELLRYVAAGHPVWIITTSTFAPVNEFETWDTPQGTVEITYKMHSVVITGFNSNYVYINNPYGEKNQKLERETFIEAWEQMGKQAIVVF